MEPVLSHHFLSAPKEINQHFESSVGAYVFVCVCVVYMSVSDLYCLPQCRID